MTTTYQFAVAKSDPAEEAWVDAADLGIENIVRTRFYAEADTLTLDLTGKLALTDDFPFAYGSLVRFRRLDTAADLTETASLLFLGRVPPIRRTADGAAERQSITIRGLWDWFERTVMRQDWTDADDVTRTAPRAVLFWADGERLTTGAQIARCVALARAAGCPCAAPEEGDIAAGFAPPVDEQQNITVAQAVSKCMSNHPHGVCWFDYSAREPVFRVASRLDLPVVELDISQDAEQVAITSREDLQPPAVAICYQKPMADGDRQWMHTEVDFAPVIAEETPEETGTRLSQAGVLWACFDLAGFSAQYQEQEQSLTVEPINWDANKASVAWWQRWCPQLTDPAITDISIVDPHAMGTLPNILLTGAVSEWMGVDQEEAVFQCDAWILTGPLILPREIRLEHLVVRLKTTDGGNKTYKKKTLVSSDSGDTIPAGLAAQMWSEWQQLHHDGSIVIVQQEARIDIGPGCTLCLDGGRPEWETMRALVTRVSESFADGSTEVEFGTPAWIDVDSRVAFERNCRNRRYSMSRNMAQPEDQAEPEETEGGAAGIQGLPGSVEGAHTGHIIRRVFDNPAAEVQHCVDIYANADLLGFEFATPADGEAARTVRVLEVLLPVAAGGVVVGAKRAQVLACMPYGDTVPLPEAEDGEDGTQFQVVSHDGVTLDTSTTPPTIKLVGTNQEAPPYGSVWGYGYINGTLQYGWMPVVTIFLG